MRSSTSRACFPTRPRHGAMKGCVERDRRRLDRGPRAVVLCHPRACCGIGAAAVRLRPRRSAAQCGRAHHRDRLARLAPCRVDGNAGARVDPVPQYRAGLAHRPLDRLKARHAVWLERVNSRPVLLIAGTAATMVIALAALLLFRAELVPPIRDGHIVASTDAPVSISPAAIRATGHAVAADIAAIAGVRAVSQEIGRDPRSTTPPASSMG